MSEYWKSTPKYWCKHCSTYVRDTKLERSNHDASPKHQGNLKRFLRDLHRSHEKEGKDKARAKAEIARLNGVSPGEPSQASSAYGKAPLVKRHEIKQATPQQRKQQLAQLAEMGIAVPDEFRGDMALVGEWQVLSERVVEGGEDGAEKKVDAVALGVRKRERDEGDEEAVEVTRGRWGRAYREHPGEDDGDLDALLSRDFGTRRDTAAKVEAKEEDTERIEEEPEAEGPASEGAPASAGDSVDIAIKKELSDEHPIPSGGNVTWPDRKPELGDDAIPGVVFKKRKAKSIRQK